LQLSEHTLVADELQEEFAPAFEAVRTQPLFGASRSVVVWWGGDVLSQLKEMARYYPIRAIQNAAENVHLLIEGAKPPAGAVIQKAFEQAIAADRDSSTEMFDAVRDTDKAGLEALVRRCAEELGIADRLDAAAVSVVAKQSGGESEQVRFLLGMLRDASGGGTITAAAARELGQWAAASLFSFAEAVLKGRHAEAVRLAQQLTVRDPYLPFQKVQGPLQYALRNALYTVCAPGPLDKAKDVGLVTLTSRAAAYLDRALESCSPDRVFLFWDRLSEWEQASVGGISREGRTAQRWLERMADAALL